MDSKKYYIKEFLVFKLPTMSKLTFYIHERLKIRDETKKMEEDRKIRAVKWMFCFRHAFAANSLQKAQCLLVISFKTLECYSLQKSLYDKLACGH